MPRTVLDVTVLVERARDDLGQKGLRLTYGLEELIRGWVTAAYQDGIEAQRQTILDVFEETPEGRHALRELARVL